MRTRLLTAAVVACLVAGSVLALRGQPASCGTDCLSSRYWIVPADDFEQSGRAPFPEDGLPELARRDDIGLAFSGGGTRSAAATLGQLRGLQYLGWLERVRYISAVSGGAWAAIPYTFAKKSTDELLGAYTPPDKLTLEIVKGPAVGALGVAIANSSLTSGALREGPAEYLSFRARGQGVSNPLLSQLSSLTNRLRREGKRDDKTYARMLGRIFIDGLIEPAASERTFSWNGVTTDEMARRNPGRLGDFVVAHADRSFLIASGAMVSQRPDYVTPLLMPVEYTPLYVGVRQQFGRFGGSYVWPWAYDPLDVGQATPDASDGSRGTVEVRIAPGRRLTLADMAASTGAAPEVAILNGLGLEGPDRARVQLAASFFPHFNHYAFRDGDRPVFSERLAHADGGGIDNLGIMPLLARQVHNIIVFNNTSTPLVENSADMQALFIPNGTATVTTDPRGNVVFDAERWDLVKNALADRREQGLPQVFCADGWSVKKNQRFNIRAYDGLSICFVYNAPADAWESALQPPVRELLTGRRSRSVGRLDNFPYYRTFGQNVTHLIQLKAPQVNLLSNLTAWVITNEETVAAVRRHFKIGGGTLPCPRGMSCS